MQGLNGVDYHNIRGNFCDLLKDLLGFSDPDIIILTDTKATKANIMKNLVSMVVEANAGKYNYLVFCLSSYGTLVHDISGDEPDNTEDAFCPYDLAIKGNQWDPGHIILEDELYDLFVRLPRNVLLEIFLDACHTGTGIRAVDLLFDRKPRYLPPPSLEAFLRTEEVRRSRGLNRSLLEKGLVHHILWTASRADQTSADALIGNTWHGAFTYYLCKEMRACKNRLSRLEVLRKVTADLKAGHYSQIPELDGEAALRRSPIL